MDKISIKAYAKKHKLSIFNVVKMTKSGQIPTETIVEEGKDVIYVLIDDVVEKEIKSSIVSIEEQEELTLKEIVKNLQKEMKMLSEEIEVLKKKI